MSWQNYVDDVLIRDGGMSNAAIHGLDGSVWATSEGFELDKSEIDKLVCGCEDPDVARSNGVHLSGEKYVTIKADGGSLCAKNADTGVYAVKTNKAVIVGTFVKPTLPGEAESAMQSFADYLLKSGYVSIAYFWTSSFTIFLTTQPLTSLPETVKSDHRLSDVPGGGRVSRSGPLPS